jgi:diacylglycerol kinase
MIIILICFIIAVTCGFIFKIKLYEWLFVLIVSGCIATCEMINSSIEAIVDLITIKEHPLAKIAKDTASGASLILCFTALIGGLIIFIPKIIVLFGG